MRVALGGPFVCKMYYVLVYKDGILFDEYTTREKPNFYLNQEIWIRRRQAEVVSYEAFFRPEETLPLQIVVHATDKQHVFWSRLERKYEQSRIEEIEKEFFAAGENMRWE